MSDIASIVTMSDSEHEIECILDESNVQGQLHYLTKSVGFPATDNTWERADVLPKNKIEEYKRSQSTAQRRYLTENRRLIDAVRNAGVDSDSDFELVDNRETTLSLNGLLGNQSDVQSIGQDKQEDQHNRSGSSKDIKHHEKIKKHEMNKNSKKHATAANNGSEIDFKTAKIYGGTSRDGSVDFLVGFENSDRAFVLSYDSVVEKCPIPLIKFLMTRAKFD